MKRFALSALALLLALPAQAEFINPRQPQTLTELRQKARNGDAASVAIIGWALRYGIGVDKNASLALELIKTAAQAGNPYGLFLLCEASDDGFGQPRDPAMAKVLCGQALPGLKVLAPHDAYAQYMLGYIYDHGLGGEASDHTQASRLYQLAAAQGHPFAMNNLGYIYSEQKNYPEAIKWYTKAAEQGDPSAQDNLGYAYQHGQGVKQDYAAAMKWYKMAADQHDASAINNLGAMFAEGQGVSKNPETAVGMYRQAADLGYAVAEYNLGLAYLLGRGVAASDAQALIWLVKASEQGMPEAQYEAGRIYLDGASTLQNYEQARRWLQAATAQGHRQAQDLLMRRFPAAAARP